MCYFQFGILSTMISSLNLNDAILSHFVCVCVYVKVHVHYFCSTLCMYVMCLSSLTDSICQNGLNAVFTLNDRAAPTDTNPKNLELACHKSVTATRLDQLDYSPNYYIQTQLFSGMGLEPAPF